MGGDQQGCWVLATIPGLRTEGPQAPWEPQLCRNRLGPAQNEKVGRFVKHDEDSRGPSPRWGPLSAGALSPCTCRLLKLALLGGLQAPWKR